LQQSGRSKSWLRLTRHRLDVSVDAAANLSGQEVVVVKVVVLVVIFQTFDKLTDIMRPVRLLMNHEISTLGAAQLAIMGKRLQQSARVLWREDLFM
jgi:hypothetical protein